MKLTPEQKLEKKQRDNLQSLCTRITMQFSLGHVKKWGDVYRFEGIDPTTKDNSDVAITFPELKAHFQELKDFLELQLQEKRDAKPVLTKEEVKKVMEQPTEGPPTIVVEHPIIDEPIASDDSYGLHVSAKELAFLFWFQKKAVAELYSGIVNDQDTGHLLLSSTGTGKTFMVGALFRRLVDIDFAKGKTFGATKYLYVTRSSIVEQTKRVFEKFFQLTIRDGVEILNIEQLRSRAGQVWLNERVVIEQGEEKTIWEWRPMMNPVVIGWDECQALKNPTSTQHAIGASFNEVKTPTVQVFISATPFTRVSEAKCFAVSTRKDVSRTIGVTGARLSLGNWPTYSAVIAGDSGPEAYNEAAVDRLVKDLDKYIIRVRGVRPQFDAKNSIRMITFATDEERKYYEDTERRYIEKKQKMLDKLKAEGKVGKDEQLGGIWELVLLNERCMAAEFCRKEHLAKFMYESVQSGQHAAVCALKFKATIIAVVKILVNKYGVSRDQISIVWGGGQTQLTKKQKTKAEITGAAEGLKTAGLKMEDIMKSLGLEDVEDRVIEELDPALRLGPQSPEERQREIDKFQSGKSLYCLYSFKAGGVGLSLHHSDEYIPVPLRQSALSQLTRSVNKRTQEIVAAYRNNPATAAKIWSNSTDEQIKDDQLNLVLLLGCRRKKSGYALERDIPFVPIRPRKNFVAPTYSAVELVQGLGRCPRLTSLSDTVQELVFYRGTVEDGVALIVAQKLRCLSRVVRMRESWQDVVVGGVASVDEHVNNTKDMIDDPDDLGGAEEEEEE